MRPALNFFLHYSERFVRVSRNGRSIGACEHRVGFELLHGGPYGGVGWNHGHVKVQIYHLDSWRREWRIVSFYLWCGLAVVSQRIDGPDELLFPSLFVRTLSHRDTARAKEAQTAAEQQQQEQEEGK